MYECYNCGYTCVNKTMMTRHLYKLRICKSIRDIDLNKCKESILNRISYIDYIKINEENNTTNNIILELNQQLKNKDTDISILIDKNQGLTNEIHKLNNKIVDLKTAYINKKSKWFDEKKKLSSKITKFQTINNNTINQ